ncbi:Uncharacterised protein [Vibrio cholerae]|uniref:Uncharacterized protein n=1 Tax=Vibrio cholerae TaxID=666 RepID=A0A655ZT66_VIBCL|nr:Uncharacterised protein [Vibrio cholerae]CSC47567.1 Uncharacterised protein [Vibrio cholerae]CSC79102.1 Uncharacterised protein [Vibrio cholerae]
MNSSTLPEASKPAGSACSTSTSLSSNSYPASRAKISNLRATSIPERSSRGSGSVKPFSLASCVAWLKVMPSSNLPKIKEREPERIPLNFSSSSPAAIRFCKFSITGRPAPTVVSYISLRRE